MNEIRGTIRVDLTSQEIDVILQALNELQNKPTGRNQGNTLAEIRSVRAKLNTAIRSAS